MRRKCNKLRMANFELTKAKQTNAQGRFHANQDYKVSQIDKLKNRKCEKKPRVSRRKVNAKELIWRKSHGCNGNVPFLHQNVQCIKVVTSAAKLERNE